MVDTNTDGPTGMGKFTSIVEFDAEMDTLVLRGATQTGGGGLYSRLGGQWSKIVSTGDPAPGGGTFTSLSLPLIDAAGGAVFMDASLGAIYTNVGGTLQRIIGRGDTLDGKTIMGTGYFANGRDGNSLAISVTFNDHAPPVSYDQAIYKVTIPVPPIGMVPLAGAALLAARPRR